MSLFAVPVFMSLFASGACASNVTAMLGCREGASLVGTVPWRVANIVCGKVVVRLARGSQFIPFSANVP